MTTNIIGDPASQLFSEDFIIETYASKADAAKQFATRLSKREVCTQASTH